MLAMPKCAIVRGRAPFSERTFSALEYLVGLKRWVGVTGKVAQAGLLLAARIWLGQAKFVHQLMMMMGAGSVCCRPDRSCHLPRMN